MEPARNPSPRILSDHLPRPAAHAPPLAYPAVSQGSACMLRDAAFSGAQPRPRALFRLGQTVITPTAAKEVDASEVLAALRRHAMGDWGELGAEDKRSNDSAVTTGARILSAYTSTAGRRFWIITEADRSVTTILLPEDY